WGLATNGSSRGLHASEMGDNLPEIPIDSPSPGSAISIGGSRKSTCVLRKSDPQCIVCWGKGGSGALGNGGTSD
ncbi:hypothetical protein AAMO2058_001681800, partial [Amorphochlora amoebiformis]